MTVVSVPLNERSDTPASGVRHLLIRSWPLMVILSIAVFLRGWGLTEWSLWEDEETSIYFSQQTNKPFPRFFPLFFLILNELYQVTGVSVTAGRLLAAGFGMVNIILVYVLTRPLSRAVALVATVLLVINLGHVFWCQSIRYFTLLLVFEMLSMYLFLEGFERGNKTLLVLSNVAFALALLTHFSALLLMPAYVAYLCFMICWGQSSGLYNLRGYFFFGLVHGIVLGLMALQFIRFHAILKGMDDLALQAPTHLLVTVMAYFGAPVILLGLLAPLVAVESQKRIALFFTTIGILPILQALVIARLNLSNVTWYYMLVGMIGFIVAAAITLISLFQRGFRRSTWLSGAAVLCYYTPLLAGYYTSMHGDRPRWKDACAYLLQDEHIFLGVSSKTQVYATVPGVVGFYLGVPPGEAMESTLVQMVPPHLPAAVPEVDRWFIVENGHVSREVELWLEKYCTLKATFAASTGPRDRSIRVYFQGRALDDDRLVAPAGQSPPHQESN